MFQYFANGPAGQKIVMMLTSSTDDELTYIRIMKKFSKNFNLNLHASRLLEKILTGVLTSPIEFTELLIKEVLPLLMSEPIDSIPPEMLYRLLAIVFKYYIANLYNFADKRHLADESKIKLFEFFKWIGLLLKWEPFPYDTKWTKEMYWQKLKQIETTTPDPKQIFYLSCYLFFISAQDYLETTKVKIDGGEIQYILIDGISEIDSPPLMNILHEPPFNNETLSSFLTTFKTQNLLQSNVLFYGDFNSIIFDLNVNRFMSRLVIDTAVYLRSSTETFRLISTSTLSNLEKTIRLLSLVTNTINSTREIFDYVRVIMNDLPPINGNFLKNLTSDRSLLFLPLTRHAIVQYCTRVIINCLKRKAFKESNIAKGQIDDFQLGSLLILLQLEFYDNIPLVEHIFEIIRVKGLEFPLFSSYIVNIDMIEEFMSIYRAGEVKLKLMPSANTPTSQRRIGTRGSKLYFNLMKKLKIIFNQPNIRCR
jgi:integrator complex subunit 10